MTTIVENINSGLFTWQSSAFAADSLLTLCLSCPEDHGFLNFKSRLDENRSERLKILREIIRQYYPSFDGPIVQMGTTSLNETAIIAECDDLHDGKVISSTDALITDRRNVAFFFSPADCLPIFLWSKEEKVAAMVHGHWRQTLELSVNAVHAMHYFYGIEHDNIRCEIGPSIQQCCYRFDRKLISDDQLNHHVWKNHIQTHHDQVAINLQSATMSNLILNGLKTYNVNSSYICTCCSKNSNQQYNFPSNFRDHSPNRFIALMLIM